MSVTTPPIHMLYYIIIASNGRIIKSREELIEGSGRGLNIVILRAFTF